MSPGAFQPWRDYFQLAKLVEGMSRADEEQSGEEARAPAAERSPERPFPSRGQEGAGGGGCSFCKQNGESRSIYASHRLKDEAGRVECPILRKYTCPQCGASDDRAHTRRFCPLTKQGYISVYTGFVRNSAGKRRKKVS